MPNKRISIEISGIVQGVGMRPTIYRHALTCSLTGFVTNTPQGVLIEVEGSESSLNNFIDLLKNDPPAQAHIDSFQSLEISVQGSRQFSITPSTHDGHADVEISPDLATCSDCLKEINDKNDRRYDYPFTNCTNCGPRFTIIHDRPYDRPLTSMNNFSMCTDCQEEYENPLDRRFHAQPNACPVCGPTLHWLPQSDQSNSSKLIDRFVQLIGEGKVGALKGLGGFNICCDPLHKKAMQKLRASKNRPQKSFALMMKDVDTIKKYCHVSQKEEDVLQDPAAPIVLLRKKNDKLDHVSPDNNYLGVILPYTPLHHLIFRKINMLILTSANKADEPIAIDDDQLSPLFAENNIDFALSHNRPIVNRADDSIVQVVGDRMQLIRRSRGFTPKSIATNSNSLHSALALGAEMKNTFAFAQGERIYLSQHIGDLYDERSWAFQRASISHLEKLLRQKTHSVLCDAHPNYTNHSADKVKVYHHHAHALSVMAENDLLGEKVLAVVCDGTGYGTDGTIWGCEFLSLKEDYARFDRVAHLAPFPLIGGEQAIFEVDRIGLALSYLQRDNFSERENQLLTLLKSGINCPSCTSLGRLFDGVAAILGLVAQVSYDAQAAILLQKEAEKYSGNSEESYPIIISSQENRLVLEYEPMICGILQDQKDDLPASLIAYKFHRWIAASIIDCITKLSPPRVAFSGGCLQNALFAQLLESGMKETNVETFTHRNVPPNDGGIAYGQIQLR